MNRDVYTNVTIGDIDIPDGRREVIRDKVDMLAQSIEKIGLRHPITVREWKDRYILVAGMHRLEAFRKLKKIFIPALITHMTKSEARMWEIAENLHRAELTVQERSDQIAEWIELAGEGISAQVALKIGKGRPTGGVLAASRNLGIERTEAQRAVKIASIAPAAKEAARNAGIDNNQAKLLKVASAAPERQVAAVREIVSPPPSPPPASSSSTEVAALLRLWNQTSPQGRKAFLRYIKES